MKKIFFLILLCPLLFAMEMEEYETVQLAATPAMPVPIQEKNLLKQNSHDQKTHRLKEWCCACPRLCFGLCFLCCCKQPKTLHDK